MEFKRGDRVRIFREARTHEHGWQNSWEDDMTKFVGKIGRVVNISSDRLHDVDVKMYGDYIVWGYPDFVLKLVEAKGATKKVARRKKAL